MIVGAPDITAPGKNLRILKIWEGKKWFLDEIRKAATKRDEAYNKMYNNTV